MEAAFLLAVIVLSVVFYRPFCKWLCPLGAFYALLNKVSLLRMQVDKQMRLLRQMRKGLQDGRGRTKTPQPHRVHPLRDVHPRLPHGRHSV